MPSFGKRSRKAVASCDEECQDVLNEAIKFFDFSVIWGFRGMEEQNDAFRKGQSRNRWPTSKHNSLPSVAFDIVPYPDGYEADLAEFYEMATYIYAAATRLGVHLEWGGHWKNYTGKGHNDRDWAHFEKIQ